MTDLSLRLPFDGAYPLTQGFGENPQWYRPFNLPGHEGLDWGLPTGTGVLAVDAGTVSKIFTDPNADRKAYPYGMFVKLSHTWGETVYAHLSRVDVKVDDVVKPGQRVGLSGNTGNSTGPHLHFGLRLKGYDSKDGWLGYTNPHRFLAVAAATGTTELAALKSQVQQARDALASAQEGFAFQRQELTTQADLWREKLADLLRRYAGSNASASADLVASLEALLQQDSLAMQLQETQAQADFWREQVTSLVRRYTPGSLPANADVLATLEALMHSWSQEVEQERVAQVAAFSSPHLVTIHTD